jgi:hypothetical protein
MATGLALIVSASAVAQTEPEPEPEKAPVDTGGWEFRLAPLYIWFAGLEGSAGIGPVNAPVNLSFGDVLENLSGIFTLHFEARKSKWSLFTDGMHLRLEPGTTLPNGAPVGVTVENDIIEVGAAYRVRDAQPSVDLLAGARYTSLEVTGFRGANVVYETWWDGFGGARMRYAFGEKKNWSVSARADAGTGGSDLTWSAYALVAWQFAKFASVTGGYKWLDYDYTNGTGLSRVDWDVTYQGPILGIVFNW